VVDLHVGVFSFTNNIELSVRNSVALGCTLGDQELDMSRPSIIFS